MKTKINSFIKEWENKGYLNGIPDEIPNRIHSLHKAPSYKAICIAILNNDYSLKSLGLQAKKNEIYHTLKKIELQKKGKYNPQLKIIK